MILNSKGLLMIEPLIEIELGIELPVRTASRFNFLSVPPIDCFISRMVAPYS